MIRTLRAFFLARLLREKILLVALVLILAVLWLSNWGGRLGHFLSVTHETTVALKQQQHWLSNRVKVENSTRKAAGRFDPTKTLDSTRLLAAVSSLANDAGLRNSTSGESQDISNGPFSVHTLQFTVTKVDWASLNTFYASLQQRSPYIGIEQFALMVDRANPLMLNASMKVSSVEIAHTAVP